MSININGWRLFNRAFSRSRFSVVEWTSACCSGNWLYPGSIRRNVSAGLSINPSRRVVSAMCDEAAPIVVSLATITNEDARSTECRSWVEYILANREEADTATTHIENEIVVKSILHCLLGAELPLLLSWQQRVVDELGIRPSLGQLNQTLLKFGYEGKSQEGELFCEQMIASGLLQPNVTTLNILLHNCKQVDDVMRALELLQTFPRRFNIAVDVVTMNTIIQMFCIKDDKENCMNWFHIFTEDWKIRPDAITLQQMLYMLARLKDTTTAFKFMYYIENVLGEKISHKALHSILSGCRISGDVESMEQWFSFAVDDLKMSPDVSMCNIIMDTYSQLGRVEDCNRWFHYMKSLENVSPSSLSYGALLKACVRNGDLRRAEQYWNLMIGEHQFRPHIHVFNVLLDGYCQNGRKERVEGWLDSLTVYDLKPNYQTVCTAIVFFASCGDLVNTSMWVNVLLDDLLDEPSDYVKGAVIQAFAKSRDMARTRLWFDKLHGRLPPNVVSFTMLMDGYAAVGDKQGVLAVLDEMDALNVTPSLVTLNCLLKGIALSPNRDFDAAELDYYMQLLMHYYGYTPDMNTFYPLLIACRHLHDADSARRYCHMMLERGIQFDFRALELVCLTLGREQFKRFYQSRPQLIEVGDLVLRKLLQGKR